MVQILIKAKKSIEGLASYYSNQAASKLQQVAAINNVVYVRGSSHRRSANRERSS